jgi:hypothetical protein
MGRDSVNGEQIAAEAGASREQIAAEDGASGDGAPAIGADGEELIMNLEPDQLVFETFRPVPRAHLSRRAVIGLWALRAFSIVVSLMVIYAFIEMLS